MALRARPHPFRHGELCRIPHGQVLGMSPERRQMPLAWPMAVFAGNARLDAGCESSRRTMAAQASHFQIWRQYTPHRSFVTGGLLYRKPQREGEFVLLRIVEVAGFKKTRNRQWQPL